MDLWLIPRLARQRLEALAASSRAELPRLLLDSTPLDLRFLGRVLLRVLLVGGVVGLVGALFFLATDAVHYAVVERLCGYRPLLAGGEHSFGVAEPATFRPWLLALVPALGGLACGILTRRYPQARGGGGNATIDAVHKAGGVIPLKAIGVKVLASIATLGTGGAGGREGPTMFIGTGLGAEVARWLGISGRERRVLALAGMAAGMAAVFHTPLGAALLTVEVLYKDGFDAEPLVPAVLASVTAYSVSVLILGQTTLFTHAPRFPFTPAHLPLYLALAVVAALAGALFLAWRARVRQAFDSPRLPHWARPAIGGLLVGLFVVALLWGVGRGLGAHPGGLGLLGGGYGAVQTAISGAAWLPDGWWAVAALAGLAGAKALVASITIASEGSAGEFAPSLAIGGLLGGAFGRAMQLLTGDARLDAGAFALVGMATFYGGIAHVPLAAMVLACEMAGNYDLLPPLMLAQGVAFVAMRRRTLYSQQLDTPAAVEVRPNPLERLAVAEVGSLLAPGRGWLSFSQSDRAPDILARAGDATAQTVFPVVDPDGRVIGVLTAKELHAWANRRDDAAWMVAADLMRPALVVGPRDSAWLALELMAKEGLAEVVVVDSERRAVGVLDEVDVARAFLRAGAADSPPAPPQDPKAS